MCLKMAGNTSICGPKDGENLMFSALEWTGIRVRRYHPNLDIREIYHTIVYIYIHIYEECMYMYIYIYICTCIYIYMYICINTLCI